MLRILCAAVRTLPQAVRSVSAHSTEPFTSRPALRKGNGALSPPRNGVSSSSSAAFSYSLSVATQGWEQTGSHGASGRFILLSFSFPRLPSHCAGVNDFISTPTYIKEFIRMKEEW
ncbi:hypothetical protein FIBSPDRAFT_1041239 [Athelia psychrophila]|uniref:Uncharacterized protein n=1 Tax=Athelia psychrophila TaxID=1759441 RepID=A0A166PAN7_9AGAM|nr:hypothetical protein FIBSPDRAFT_1041239 [Fibularhizoctonia sp. CBS 109695]